MARNLENKELEESSMNSVSNRKKSFLNEFNTMENKYQKLHRIVTGRVVVESHLVFYRM